MCKLVVESNIILRLDKQSTVTVLTRKINTVYALNSQLGSIFVDCNDCKYLSIEWAYSGLRVQLCENVKQDVGKGSQKQVLYDGIGIPRHLPDTVRLQKHLRKPAITYFMSSSLSPAIVSTFQFSL